MPSIALRMILDARRSLAWWTLGIAALVWVNILFYPSFKDSPDLERIVEQSPDLMRALLGGRESLDILSPAGYLDSQVYALMAPLLILVFAIGNGAGTLAGEEERGRLELLLANPVGRRRVVAEKALGLVCLVLAFGAVVWISVWTSCLAFGLEIGAGRITSATLALVLIGSLFGLVALLAGAASGRRGVAIGVGAALAVSSYLLTALAPLADWLEPWKVASPFHYYASYDQLLHGLDPANAVLLAAVSVFLLALALVAFERRDLRLGS
jgi:ABC-2 type transport system permease protein